MKSTKPNYKRYLVTAFEGSGLPLGHQFTYGAPCVYDETDRLYINGLLWRPGIIEKEYLGLIRSNVLTGIVPFYLTPEQVNEPGMIYCMDIFGSQIHKIENALEEAGITVYDSVVDGLDPNSRRLKYYWVPSSKSDKILSETAVAAAEELEYLNCIGSTCVGGKWAATKAAAHKGIK